LLLPPSFRARIALGVLLALAAAPASSQMGDLPPPAVRAAGEEPIDPEAGSDIADSDIADSDIAGKVAEDVESEPFEKSPSEPARTKHPEAHAKTTSGLTEDAATAPKEWQRKVNELLEAIRLSESGSTEADALFHQLSDVLWKYQDEVEHARRERSDDALQRREILTSLYEARLRLLPVISTQLSSRLIGGGRDGMKELFRELDYVRQHLAFQALAIPHGFESVVEGITESPLDDLWLLLQLGFGLLVFRQWRRWAQDGLSQARSRVLAIRPRQKIHQSTSKFLWYANRVRFPLEYMAALLFLSALFEPGAFEEIGTLIWTVLWWLLLARFAVLMIDALATRGIGGLRGQESVLRQRSLRLVAAWGVLLGLGLDLTASYAGEGVIYNWLRRSLALASVPVALLLIKWWREKIFAWLAAEGEHSASARRLAAKQSGALGYAAAGAGAAYLLGVGSFRYFLRKISLFELGRRSITFLIRREVERDATRIEIADEERISEEIAQRLLHSEMNLIDAVESEPLDTFVSLVEEGGGGLIVVIGERGSGRSTFLRRAALRLNGGMCVVDCPPGGYELLCSALATAVELPEEEKIESNLGPHLASRGIRVIGIDNFHRLSRPYMGGQRDVERLSQMAAQVGGDVLWIASLNRSAWLYITMARGDRAIQRQVIELASWTDDQIGELIQLRSKAAGISVDYRSLVLPRQLDAGEHPTIEKRNEVGFHRIIWELSGGNPAVALRLFSDSLRFLPDGRHALHMPQLAQVAEAAKLNVKTLLVLRVVVQCDVATIDDIASSLSLARPAVANLVSHCTREGWIDEANGFFRISDKWFRTITQLLTRQNLLPR